MKPNKAKWMKIVLPLMAAILLLIPLLGCAGGTEEPTTEPQEKSFTLSLHSNVPAGSTAWEIPGANFLKTIEEKSGGTLKGKYYGAGELAPAADLWSAVSQGAVDIAWGGDTYFSARAPEGKVVADFPFVFLSAADAREVFALLEEESILTNAYGEHNLKFLGASCGGGVGLWLKKPISSIADIKGVKIRHYGAFADMLTELGASVVFIAHPDVYTALATGTIDGSGTSFTFYEDLKYYELCPYFVQPFLAGSIAQGVVINATKWNQMSENQQQIIWDAAQVMHAEFEKMMDDTRDALLDKIKNDQLGSHTEIITLPDSDIQKMTELGLGYLEAWSKEDNPDSARIARIVEIIREYLKAKGRL